MNVKQELAQAIRGDYGGSQVWFRPNLALRHQLAAFALANGLADENQALAVVAARYFRMAESERWASWFSEEGK